MIAVFYNEIRPFYSEVDPVGEGYKNHNWYGHRWNYQRIPYNRLGKNWKTWEENGHWEKRGTTWGVKNYEPRPEYQRNELKQQWQHEYHQRPEVQQHQQWKEQQEKQKEHRGREGGEEKSKPGHND